jgi:outer membrane receptor protein involved in Fe transport
MTLSSNVTWRPFNWLNLRANGGIDLTDRFTYITVQPGVLPISESWANGFRNSERENMFLYSGVLSGVANFQLRHDLFSTTTLGTQYTKNLWEATRCYGSSLVLGTSSCSTTSALFTVDEDYFEIITVGGYVQQELAWRDKVFLAGGLRGDDNSSFGADFGFVYYPSASLSWVIGEEGWFPEMDFMSGLRLRTAFGTSGLRPGMRDAVTLYAPLTAATKDGDQPGVALSALGNPQLKPEKSTEFELGFDVGLFQDRLGVDFTYFNKESKDALIERRLPGSLGLTTTVFDNLGKVKNTGTELGVNFSAIQNENIGLNIGFTNTTLKNEVLELGEGVDDIIINRGQQRHAEGYSAGSFFQRAISWDDADGNGLLTNDEVTIADEATFVGVALPEWSRTFFADLRLFNWITISTLFEGRGGHKTIDFTENFRCGFRDTRGCGAVADPTASLEYQAAHIADRYLGSGAGFIYDADFYKWRELSITFDMPSYLTDYMQQLDGLRLTLAGRNLAIWTDYPGLDPEANEGGGDDNFGQSEFNTQPPVRYLMLRLDYSF